MCRRISFSDSAHRLRLLSMRPVVGAFVHLSMALTIDMRNAASREQNKMMPPLPHNAKKHVITNASRGSTRPTPSEPVNAPKLWGSSMIGQGLPEHWR